MERTLGVLLRLRLVIADDQRDDEALERLLEGFIATHAEASPVVAQDIKAGTLSVVVSYEASDMDSAVSMATRICIEGVEAAGIEQPRLINLDVSVLPTREKKDSRELQAA
jgi:hypothetical protein